MVWRGCGGCRSRGWVVVVVRRDSVWVVAEVGGYWEWAWAWAWAWAWIAGSEGVGVEGKSRVGEATE